MIVGNMTKIKEKKQPKISTFLSGKTCERCGCKVPDDYSYTPFDEMFCDDCIDIDHDVFREEE